MSNVKFTLDYPVFASVASTVLKGVGGKADSVQTGIKIEDDKLIIQSSSQGGYFFKGEVPITSSDLGNSKELSWAIDGGQLKTILGVVPKVASDISFDLSDSGSIFNIKTASNKFRLPIVESSIFELEVDSKAIGNVSGHEFIDRLIHFSKLPSTSPVHQETAISCIALRSEDGELVWMGSDNAIIAEDRHPIDNAENFNILIKPAQANLLISNDARSIETLTLHETNNMFGFIDNLGTLCLVSKSNMEPIQYAAFLNLPTEGENFKFNSSDLKHAIDSAHKLYPNHEELKLVIKNKELTVENESLDQIKVFPEEITIDESKHRIITFKKKALSLALSMVGSKGVLSWDEKANGYGLGRVYKLNSEEERLTAPFIGITVSLEENE